MKKKILFMVILFFCFIGFVKAEKCLIVTGDGTHYGDEIRCGTENFYVLKHTNNKTTLLAKYNLFVGDKISYIEADENAPHVLRALQDTFGDYCRDLAMSRGYNPYYVYPVFGNDGSYLAGCRVYEKLNYEHIRQDERAKGTILVNGVSQLPLYGITYMVPEWGYDAMVNNIIHQNVYDPNGDLILEGSSFEGWINGYKDELISQGLNVETVEMAKVSKILEFMEGVYGQPINVQLEGTHPYWQSCSDTDPDDCVYKMDIKDYVSSEYSWIYNVTYWNGSGFKYEDQTDPLSPAEFNDYYISNEGFLCALGRGQCGYFGYPIGNGVRPLVTVQNSDIVQGNLIVNYLDQYGMNIDSSANRNEYYNYGSSYTTEQLPFTNYNFVNRTGDAANGTITKETTTVNYNYQIKSADVTTRYIDEAGNNIVAPSTVESYWGNSYSTVQRSFPNYNYVGLANDSDAASGIVGKDHVVVKYVYHLKDANLVVRHINIANNQNLIPVITTPVHYGDEYHITPSPNVSNNYELVSTQGDSENGIVSQDTIEVKYYYRIKTANIIVRHINADTMEDLIPPSTTQMNWGEEYHITPSTSISENYALTSTQGDSENGIVGKSTIEVQYYYTLKGATLKVRYVDQDQVDIDASLNRTESVHWGDQYTSSVKEIQNYDYVNRTGDPANGTINKNLVEVIYNYQIRSATLVVKYVDAEGHDIDPTKNRNESVHWGDQYSSQELTFDNYQFVEQTGDDPSGIIGANRVEVIYHYELKPSTITVHHYVKNTTTRVAPDETIPKRYTQTYTTSQTNTEELDYEYDSVVGDTSGTVTQDSYEVTYYYKLKKGTVRVHHYIVGTTTKLAEDVDTVYDYTSEYGTSISTDVPSNYEFYSKSDNFTGIVRAPLIEVKYYYQLKDSNLDSSITITGPEEITNKNANVEYHIKYDASILEYIGDGTVVIINTLPYAIDVDNSNLNGGTYNSSNRTITWTQNYLDINTYNETDETKKITIEKDISLRYVGIVGRDRSMVSNVVGTIELSNNGRETTNSVSTNIKISGKITVKYVDDKNKELKDSVVTTGLVGESYVSSADEIEGYKIIERPSTEEYEYEEEDQVVTYVYERLKVQITIVGNDGGDVTGDEIVYYGDDSTPEKLVIKARDGYVIESVKINDVQIDIKPNQQQLVLGQLHQLKEDQRIEVKFKPVEALPNPETGAFISILIAGIVAVLGIALYFVATRSQKLRKI